MSEFRFGVFSPSGARGSTWKLWTTKATGDVYIAHREAGRWMKTSLHESGELHFSPPSGSPMQDRPSLPTLHRGEIICPGWYRALRITVPTSELRSEFVEKTKDASVHEVIADLNFAATVIDIYLGDPGSSDSKLPTQGLLARLSRGDGGSVIAHSHSARLDEPPRLLFANEISEIEATLRVDGWNGKEARGIVLFGSNESGFLQQIELTVPSLEY